MRLIDLCEGRLDELKPSHAKGLRDMQKKTSSKLQTFLRKHGFRNLGTGVYSTVWGAQNSNFVVKVTKGFGDRCWLTFAEYVGKNKNKHYPRLSSVKLYTDSQSGKKNFYCFMERLSDIKQIPMTPDNKPLIAFLITVFGESYVFGKEKEYAEFLGFGIRLYELTTSEHVKEIASQYTDSESFNKAVEQLKTAKPVSCDWDLHLGNVMFRESTKTLVIIDPYIK